MNLIKKYIHNNNQTSYFYSFGVCLLLILILSSCKDDINENTSFNGKNETLLPATLQINLNASQSLDRTRSINLTNTDLNQLRSLWIGVFDIQTRNIVGHDFFYDSQIAESVKVNIMYYDNHPKVRIVGVANFDGLRDCNQKSIVESLEAIEQWSDFTDITLDLTSLTDANESTNPVMVGYFYNSGIQNCRYIAQYDFKTQMVVPDTDYTSGTARENAKNATTVLLLKEEDKNSKRDPEFSIMSNLDGALQLRRLIVHSNVTITSGEGVEISNVSYKRINMPKAIYLAERKVDTEGAKYNESEFSNWQLNSANAADKMLIQENNDASIAYESDNEFISESIENKDGVYSFSFQHYENKHWGNIASTDYNERVKLNENSALKALCPSEASFNNYASCFVVRMMVKTPDKSAYVNYLIPEGYCNDEFGVSQSNNISDFSTFRNTIYNYKINVTGLNSFSFSADSKNIVHPDGMNGVIWTIDELTSDKNLQQLGWNGIQGVDGMVDKIYVLKNLPQDMSNFVWRFYDENGGEPIDYCTSELDESLQHQIAWPDLSSDYTIEKSLLNDKFRVVKVNRPNGGSIFDVFLINSYDGLCPTSNSYSEWWVIIKAVEKENLLGVDDLSLYKRAFFIYDKNELENSPKDDHGCFGANMTQGVYIPEDPRIQLAEPTPIYNKYSITNWQHDFWDGAVNTLTPISWKKVDNANNYKISINGVEYKGQGIDEENDDTITRYILLNDDETLNFGSASSKSYIVNIQAVGNNLYYAPSESVGNLSITKTIWDFSESPWTKIQNDDFPNQDKEYKIYGLSFFTSKGPGDYFTKNLNAWGGTGSTSDRYFRFKTNKSGSLSVYTSRNSGSQSDDRYIVVNIDGNEYQIRMKDNTTASTQLDFTDLIQDALSSNDIHDIYIYPKQNLRIHKIEFNANN